MYLLSGDMAALEALPVEVIRLTFIVRNGVVLFRLKRAYRPNDKPATTSRAATTATITIATHRRFGLVNSRVPLGGVAGGSTVVGPVARLTFVSVA
jgi:hypothetical protein